MADMLGSAEGGGVTEGDWDNDIVRKLELLDWIVGDGISEVFGQDLKCRHYK